jgi:peptidoglycan/LPS O-acetylase OafA/YrhL
LSEARLVGLDGLRGVAALVVTYFHIRSAQLGYNGFPAGDGYLAVDLFFVLSGYVIPFAYESRLDGGLAFRNFMRARLLRLYPLYALGLALALIFSAWSLTPSPLSVGFLLTAGFEVFVLPSHFIDNEQLFPLNNPFWSLFYELLLNVGFFWFRYRLRDGAAKLLVMGVSGLAMIVITVRSNGAATGNLWGLESAIGGASRSIFSFTMGAWLYSERTRIERIWASRDVRASSYIAGGITLVALLTVPVPDNLRVLFDLAFVIIISPALVVLAVRPTSKSPLFNWSLQRLGELSYPLYTTHWALFPMIVLGFGSGFLWAKTIAAVLALALAAFAASRLFDRPVRRRLAGLNAAAGR